ncbi:MAG: hypothetical protein QOG60_2317, partial [Frankiaceae bacterium]|nr:hypothetical protein [Frankiaceae bacterium]
CCRSAVLAGDGLAAAISKETLLFPSLPDGDALLHTTAATGAVGSSGR